MGDLIWLQKKDPAREIYKDNMYGKRWQRRLYFAGTMVSDREFKELDDLGVIPESLKYSIKPDWNRMSIVASLVMMMKRFNFKCQNEPKLPYHIS